MEATNHSSSNGYTPRTIFTRSCCGKKRCPSRRRRPTRVAGVETRLAWLRHRPNLLSLPREIHLAILGHLGSCDLHTMRQVCVYFEEMARDPMLWKDYEVIDNVIKTKSVIGDLKRMPFLKKICISNRSDCDDILRQISVSNKNLEQLSVVNCTGSTSGLYLRANNLTRIAKRCRRLHTFQVLGTRFRGLKLFRMMGEAGPRLRTLLATTTSAQFRAFARHASHVAEKDRKLLAALPRRRLATMQYRALADSRITFTYEDRLLGMVDLELRAVGAELDRPIAVSTCQDPPKHDP